MKCVIKRLHSTIFSLIRSHAFISTHLVLYGFICLEVIGMDLVISDSCHKGTILQRNYRKMTILPIIPL